MTLELCKFSYKYSSRKIKVGHKVSAEISGDGHRINKIMVLKSEHEFCHILPNSSSLLWSPQIKILLHRKQKMCKSALLLGKRKFNITFTFS